MQFAVHVKPKRKMSREDKIFHDGAKAPLIADQLQLIEQLRSDSNVGFYYMKYAVDRSSEFFTPYALKYVILSYADT